MVLEHAKTWLKPGGAVFVIAHDKTNVDDGYGGPSSPDVCYSVDDTVAALEGLTIATALTAERSVDTESGQQTALDTLVIARRNPLAGDTNPNPRADGRTSTN